MARIEFDSSQEKTMNRVVATNFVLVGIVLGTLLTWAGAPAGRSAPPSSKDGCETWYGRIHVLKKGHVPPTGPTILPPGWEPMGYQQLAVREPGSVTRSVYHTVFLRQCADERIEAREEEFRQRAADLEERRKALEQDREERAAKLAQDGVALGPRADLNKVAQALGEWSGKQVVVELGDGRKVRGRVFLFRGTTLTLKMANGTRWTGDVLEAKSVKLLGP